MPTLLLHTKTRQSEHSRNYNNYTSSGRSVYAFARYDEPLTSYLAIVKNPSMHASVHISIGIGIILDEDTICGELILV